MRIIIIGGNRGVGKAVASALASAGHEVVIACRAVDDGWTAAEAMYGDVEVQRLDLADLASVHKFAEAADEVDILINNAGVLGLPPTRTQGGFEAHMGTNHLGHFALTCLLGERIKNRIICVTSSLYQFARLHADDLNRERRRYSSYSAYAESKLANMLFVHELARRGRTAYAADPGSVATDIFRDANRVAALFGQFCGPLFAQTLADGARSTLAAVTTTLPSGTYFAPRGLAHQWGTPRARTAAPQSSRHRDVIEAMGDVGDADQQRLGYLSSKDSDAESFSEIPDKRRSSLDDFGLRHHPATATHSSGRGQSHCGNLHGDAVSRRQRR